MSTGSKYTVMNGVIYLGFGALLIAWPGVTQTIFMDRAFVGHEETLIRVMGMAVAVIGWHYLFGGRSGGRQVVAASVVDRLVLIPAVLVPLAIAGVFPHLLVTFAILALCSALVPGCLSMPSGDSASCFATPPGPLSTRCDGQVVVIVNGMAKPFRGTALLDAVKTAIEPARALCWHQPYPTRLHPASPPLRRIAGRYQRLPATARGEQSSA